MKKIKIRLIGKFIFLSLINLFFLSDIASAGRADVSAQCFRDCLSPSIQINAKLFNENFSQNRSSLNSQLIAAGIIKSSEDNEENQAVPPMENIWHVLLNMPGSRIKDLKGIVTFRDSQTGNTQDKFEHTKMLVDFEQGLDESRNDQARARNTILSRKSPYYDNLDTEKIDRFLDYYYQLSQNELKLLRFAIALHDLGNIYGKGEDHFGSKRLAEPLLDRFLEQGIIDEKEYKVVIALIFMHNTFNTIHYGEMLPESVSRYLESENVDKQLYFKLAPILYVADVGSVGQGRLSDAHLSNALFMSKEANMLTLVKNWQAVRLYFGFCGYEKVIIDFTKTLDLSMPKYLRYTLRSIEENSKADFNYFWNDFLLKHSSFGGHAVYIFRYLNDFSLNAEDKENALVKFLYITSLIYKQDGKFDYILFAPATNDSEFARKLHRILAGASIEQINKMFEDSISFAEIAKKLGIVYKLNGNVLEIDTAKTKQRINAVMKIKPNIKGDFNSSLRLIDQAI